MAINRNSTNGIGGVVVLFPQPASPIRSIDLRHYTAGVGGLLVIDNYESKFKELADKWRLETGMYSSPAEKIDHPAYQAIIAMGQHAIPLILGELRDRPAYWFPALKAITNQTPVGLADRGNPQKVRAAWLKWGKERGFIE